MGRKSRRKGHNYEREVARGYRDELGLDAKRGYQTRDGSSHEADVEGTPFHVECKRHAKVRVQAEYNIAVQKKGEDDSRPVVLHHKDDRGTALVTLSQDDWFHLLRRIL